MKLNYFIILFFSNNAILFNNTLSFFNKILLDIFITPLSLD